MSFHALFSEVKSDSETNRVAATISESGISFHTIDKCEACDCDCLGVNGTPWLSSPEFDDADYKAMTLDFGASLLPLPELGHCEALGIATCESCWIDEEE